MRMLMSLVTRITGRFGCFWRRCKATAMIWLSAREVGSEAGSSPLIASVCRNSRPLAWRWEGPASAIPAWMSSSLPLTISSSMRLAWRALRATSDMPFLFASSSSKVIIGTNRSCSSKRNRQVGSCSRTLVSSTNSLVGLA